MVYKTGLPPHSKILPTRPFLRTPRVHTSHLGHRIIHDLVRSSKDYVYPLPAPPDSRPTRNSSSSRFPAFLCPPRPPSANIAASLVDAILRKTVTYFAKCCVVPAFAPGCSAIARVHAS